MLVAKIHGATVTEANLEYEGSITLDPVLMDAVGLIPYEQVHVLDLTNGARLETYAIVGREGSGEVCINGAAAHLVDEGDKVIILSYHQLDDADARDLAPRIVYLGESNVIERRARGEGIRHRDNEPVSAN
jgi:aspartate 1-decarboxylase